MPRIFVIGARLSEPRAVRKEGETSFLIDRLIDQVLVLATTLGVLSTCHLSC